MRVVRSVSTDSGKSSAAPCCAANTSSRRNSGLPAARAASVSRASSASPCSCATATASACAAASPSGGRTSRVPGPPSVRIDSADGRAVTHTSHGRGAACETRWRSRSSEASSSQCVSSTTISVGVMSTRSRKASTVTCSRSRLCAGSKASVSAVGDTLASNGIASSGSHGARSGSIACTHGASSAPASSRECSAVIPASGRRRSRQIEYGAVAAYTSTVA